MEITVIHGQMHKGSTYNITKKIIEKLNFKEKQVNEFFLPKDMPKFCIGCYQCFYKGANKCNAKEEVQKIVDAIKRSNIVIIDSPTYCNTMSGQLKTFFDHLAYMWLPHRPEACMFNKIGIAISTTAGAGAKNTVKDIKQQMNWLGISTVFTYGKTVKAYDFSKVSLKIKKEIENETTKIAGRVNRKNGIGRVNIKTKFLFNIMRMMQKGNDWNKLDKKHWDENGWLKNSKPW
jgi:multimeric flavodoxin WrbA